MSELVSVIIPTYNRERTILRAINSVLNQTYKDIEVIVVDDCSTDKTVDIIKDNFPDNHRVKLYILEKNSGACVARNRGIKCSKGKYVAFLDSDDEYCKEKIQKQIDKLEKFNLDLCACDYYQYDEYLNRKLIKTKPGSRMEVLSELLYCNFVTTGTLIGRRKCFVDIQFDENLPRYQDWDLVLRLYQTYSMDFIEEPLLLQYCQKNSISSSTGHKKTLEALELIFEKNEEIFSNDKRANGQIHWMMGLHSLFCQCEPKMEDLWKGVISPKFSIKRFLIYLYSWFGGRKYILKYFV